LLLAGGMIFVSKLLFLGAGGDGVVFEVARLFARLYFFILT